LALKSAAVATVLKEKSDAAVIGKISLFIFMFIIPKDCVAG
jgi:hypothetical protein